MAAVVGGIQGSAGSVYILAGLLAFKIVKTQKEASGITLFYTSVPLTLAAAYEYYIKETIDCCNSNSDCFLFLEQNLIF